MSTSESSSRCWSGTVRPLTLPGVDHALLDSHSLLPTERRREVALESVGVTTSVLLDSVNSGVAEVFVNQEELEREAKQLQAQSARLAKNANQWLNLVNEMSTALKATTTVGTCLTVMPGVAGDRRCGELGPCH